MTRHSAAEKRKHDAGHRSTPSPLFGSVKLTHAERKDAANNQQADTNSEPHEEIPTLMPEFDDPATVPFA